MKLPKEKYTDPKSWPVCPECKGRDLISMSGTVKCLGNCNWTGRLEDIEEAPMMRFTEVHRMIQALSGENAAQYGPLPQDVDQDFGNVINQRLHELRQETLFDRYLYQAREYKKRHGKLPLVCIIYKRVGTTPTLMYNWLTANDDAESIRKYAQKVCAGAQAVGLLFPADREGADLGKGEWNVDGEKVALNVHYYGLRPWPHGIENFLMWQPLDWDVIPQDHKTQAIRHIGVIQAKDDTNVTQVVSENLDTGELTAELSIRTPGKPTENYIRRTLPVDGKTLEEAVEFCKSIAERTTKSATDQGIPIDFKMDLEFGLEVDGRALLGKIKSDPMWLHPTSIAREEPGR